jgi:hypothetical protein
MTEDVARKIGEKCEQEAKEEESMRYNFTLGRQQQYP